MKTVEERLDALELKVKRYRAIAIVLAFTLVAGSLMAARRVPKIVRCQKLQLENARGEIRAELEVESDGAILTLADDMGIPRTMVGLKQGRAGMFLTDRAWNTRAELIIDKDTPVFALKDSSEQSRISLNMDKNETPSVNLFDAKGNPRASLDVDDKGPSLNLSDPIGKSVAYLAVTKDGSDLTLSDADRNPRIALTAYKDGPNLLFLDSYGRQKVILSDNAIDTRLTFHDSKGKIRVGIASVKRGGSNIELLNANEKHTLIEP